MVLETDAAYVVLYMKQVAVAPYPPKKNCITVHVTHRNVFSILSIECLVTFLSPFYIISSF